ncbi:heat-inducible transcriptional repressor HrcA [Kribbella sp. CA-293567]|uniref:heat-inducible transcriptional repressor HrcA n=1 Tax=Kribbella sp. CA-293567 TaxID=3002436 RepID=UPI0022DE6F28|nr:heat-inducible transcriptional repressor HrcA [Kribbella sp. CA-293567]WBQ03127.1 heat-inducible transcriptional repressor HrcA [Kribbella sp. CA-293567]
MLDERKLDVLRAIVEDYVATHEPVGSKTLVDRHNLGVSPATVRNDMAALEEEGYITQPHTSAGRIPTDAGYRLFVDKLSTVKSLSQAEKKAISSFLVGAVDLDDVVRRTVRLLAQITRQVAIVQYPTLSRSSVRHIEVVTMTPRRLLLVLITSTGRVEQRIVEAQEDVDEQLIADLRSRLNSALTGQRLTDAATSLASVSDTFAPADRPLVAAIVTSLLEAFTVEGEQRIAVGGAANLTRYGDDFERNVKPVLEALEEHVILLKLLGEATSPQTLTVRIGHENPYEGLVTTSVVATGYGSKSEALATLGIVGPTHMDYPSTMGAVRAVARYVSQILADS